MFLGDSLEPDAIEANYDRGVLTLTVPVAEQASLAGGRFESSDPRQRASFPLREAVVERESHQLGAFGNAEDSLHASTVSLDGAQRYSQHVRHLPVAVSEGLKSEYLLLSL